MSAFHRVTSASHPGSDGPRTRHLQRKENHRRRNGYVDNSQTRVLTHTHCATTTALSSRNSMVDPKRSSASEPCTSPNSEADMDLGVRTDRRWYDRSIASGATLQPHRSRQLVKQRLRFLQIRSADTPDTVFQSKGSRHILLGKNRPALLFLHWGNAAHRRIRAHTAARASGTFLASRVRGLDIGLKASRSSNDIRIFRGRSAEDGSSPNSP